MSPLQDNTHDQPSPSHSLVNHNGEGGYMAGEKATSCALVRVVRTKVYICVRTYVCMYVYVFDDF